jgi:hypothetical protein
MRVLVSIVMVLVPVTILATNDKVLSVLPPSVEKYVGLNAKDFAGGVVSIAVEAERRRDVLLFLPDDGRAEELAFLKFEPTKATRSRLPEELTELGPADRGSVGSLANSIFCKLPNWSRTS